MRIAIREQLGLLILLSSLIGLGVIAVATWITNHNFVLSIRSSRLSLTASLKAAQMASNLNLMHTSADFVTTRVLIQSALQRYNASGDNTAQNWARASADMVAAIGGEGSVGQALLMQSMVFPVSGAGPGGSYGLLNTTAANVNNIIKLPLHCPDGSDVYFGDGQCDNLGYPPIMYPTLAYSTRQYNSTQNISHATFEGDNLGPQSAMLIGPWQVNGTLSLFSMTLPIVNNTSNLQVLGWLTVVMDARLIQEAVQSKEGLDATGQTLLVGPVSKTNLFPPDVLYTTNNGTPPKDFLVRYLIPLEANGPSRTPGQPYGTPMLPFNASKYPAIQRALTHNNSQTDNSGAEIRAINENGDQVSVGFALPQADFVQWAVLVEQSRREVWQPIDHLRDILIACVFSTAAFMAIVAFPIAHVFSLPIRILREATMRSVEPPGMTASRSSIGSSDSAHDGARDAREPTAAEVVIARKEGFLNPMDRWRKRQEDRDARRDARRKREFRIPGKVKERKYFIKDELSDLTRTFNEMSDELMMQYSKLEERVQQRTAELELSKKAAEAANESKTLFIANISHELKTPLNGILGMCAVCMQEDDPTRLKRSLGIIYKSGDLLLNLLTDLLTFSKNQVGQQLSLDEKEFRLRDVSSQILAIFDKQAKEGQIDLRVAWEGRQYLENDNASPERKDYGPAGTGRMKDMILWGDTHRILQVVINLVSNSLKFTPPGGSVVLTIRCLPEVPQMGSRKGSMNSRQSRQRSSRAKNSDVTIPGVRSDVAVALGAKAKPSTFVSEHERASSPPPGRYLYFEFEVQDTGPGISENLQHKIFEPFVQGDLGLSKKYGGTGLGLSICRQLAALMRGSVRVQSTLGQGSTFTMKIPLRHLQSRADSTASSSVDLNLDSKRKGHQLNEDGDRAPARHSRHLDDDAGDNRPTATDHARAEGSTTPTMSVDSQPRLVGLSQPFFASSQPLESPGSQSAAAEQLAAEATRGGRIRVLVAEDNKVNQEVVTRMLKLEDIYDVTVAKDGQEALDLVKESMSATGKSKGPYNLIFMDVQMPNVDGLQSTRLIRQIGYQAPIVALTAFAEESNIKDCLDSGMNYFLSKPIRRPQLRKVLKEYCAPIPEEESEDVTPPDAATTRGPGSPNTTIVMVNNPPASETKTEANSTVAQALSDTQP